MGVSQQAASKAAAELERLGYVERVARPGRRARAPARAERARAGGGRGGPRRARGGRGGARRRRSARGAPRRCGRRCSTRSTPAGGTGRPCARGACRPSASLLIVSATISVTHVSDPGCPWAYSAAPHHAVLHWRYGDQLDWRLALIGLAERGEDYDARGYAPGQRRARLPRSSADYGMPFDTQPRERNIGTGRACRAIVAARLLDPDAELLAFRALQLARFTTTTLFDTDDGHPRRAGADPAGRRDRRRDRRSRDRGGLPGRPRARCARRPAARPSSRARRRTPTAPSATPRRRWSSRTATGARSRRAGTSRSRPTTW